MLERHNRLLRPFFAKHRGSEVKTIGDSFLIEFSSALEATKCAIEIQEFLHDYNFFSSNKDWKRYIPSWGRAVIYAGLEDGDKTIEWLGIAYEERWSMTYTKVDPAFHFLRNDDRFKSLLKKMGL